LPNVSPRIDRYPKTNNLHVSSHSCQTRRERVATSCDLQPTPYLPPTRRAVAITDDASPFALRSTRNRLRTAMRRGRCWSNAVSVPPIAFVEPREHNRLGWCAGCQWQRGANSGLVGQVGDPFGPEHRRELASMLGRHLAATTGTPSATTLPQGTRAPLTTTITTTTTTTPGSGRTWAAWSAWNDIARRVLAGPEPQLWAGRGGRQPAEDQSHPGRQQAAEHAAGSTHSEDDSDPPAQRPGPARPLNRPLLAPPSQSSGDSLAGRGHDPPAAPAADRAGVPTPIVAGLGLLSFPN